MNRSAHAARSPARSAPSCGVGTPSRWLAVAFAALALALAGCDALPPLPWSDADADGARLYGNVDIREVQLAFRAGGRLAEVLVDEGDAVAAGDTVARLDDTPLAQALAVAEARVAEAEAALAGVRAGTREEEIRRIEAQVRAVEVALANATRNAERQDSLARSRNTSQSALDDARAARDSARARLAEATEALALARAGARTEDVRQGEATVAVARARAAEARTRLDDAVLHAPAPGIVASRAREPGSLVSAGQPVLGLSLTERVYVRAYVDEPRLGSVAPGTRVEVRSDSSERAYAARIGFVSPRAEFTPKSVETPELRTDLVYRLRVLVDAPDEALRQGMPVTVVLPAPAS